MRTLSAWRSTHFGTQSFGNFLEFWTHLEEIEVGRMSTVIEGGDGAVERETLRGVLVSARRIRYRDTGSRNNTIEGMGLNIHGLS